MTQTSEHWLPAPRRIVLDDDEAHVWRADLHREPSTVRSFFDLLAPDEKQRANRFHFEKDRTHFVVARGVLRRLLARYLDADPALLRFTYNRFGKPALAHDANDPPLNFNLSHAHGLALYALTRGREIGLDVEFIRPEFAGLEIAERFFSPAEVAALRALPAHWQTEAFFNCWTRKEAYIKARGEGLSHPLDSFTVSLAPGQPATLLSADDPHEASRWSLAEIKPATGYAAALVIEGAMPGLHYWQWSD